MIVTVGSTKGGVGKTMLSYNLAIGLVQCGQDVLLIDGDEQKHAAAYAEIRANRMAPDEIEFATQILNGKQIQYQVPKLKRRYNQILIDTGGRNTDALRAALIVSDLVLMPVAPRSSDVWGAKATAELADQARMFNKKLKAMAVLNNADPTGQSNDEALNALRDTENLEVSEHTIMRCKAMALALDLGKGILEYKNNDSSKARAEISSLLHYIYPAVERKIA